MKKEQIALLQLNLSALLAEEKDLQKEFDSLWKKLDVVKSKLTQTRTEQEQVATELNKLYGN